MSYDEALAERVRELIGTRPDVSEMRMFGGLAFLVAGNMAVAASGSGGLMVRVDPHDAEALTGRPHAGPFEMRGAPGGRLAARRRRGRGDEIRARAVGGGRRRLRGVPASEALRSAPPHTERPGASGMGALPPRAFPD